jgi:isopentenyldiphosphate isomerase
VDAGETYAIAAVRELQEELGIVIDSVAAMQLLFEHAACRETGNEFIEVYRLIWDGEVVPNPEEVSEGRWIDPVELDHWIARNRRDFAPSFRLVWRKAREMGNV